MLLSFKVSNFKSILEPVYLSLTTNEHTASQNGINSQYKFHELKKNVNSFSIITGASGTGKSSIIEALYFVMKISNREKVETIPRNKQAPEDMPSIFEVCFYAQDNTDGHPLRKYTVEVSPQGYVTERGSFYAEGRWKVIYQNNISQESGLYIPAYSLKDKEPQSFENGKLRLRIDWDHEFFDDYLYGYACDSDTSTFFHNSFFFISEENDLDYFHKLWLSKETTMEIEEMSPGIRSLVRENTYLKGKPYFKETLIKVLNSFGINVIDLKFKLFGAFTKSNLDDDLEIVSLPDDFEDDPEAYVYYEVPNFPMSSLSSLVYPEYEVLIEDETPSVIRIVKLAFALVREVIRKDGILFILDENDGLADLSPTKIAEQFLRICETYDRKDHQLVIACKEKSLIMSSSDIRKEQITITRLNSSTRTTELYSLADLRRHDEEELV